MAAAGLSFRWSDCNMHSVYSAPSGEVSYFARLDIELPYFKPNSYFRRGNQCMDERCEQKSRLGKHPGSEGAETVQISCFFNKRTLDCLIYFTLLS